MAPEGTKLAAVAYVPVNPVVEYDRVYPCGAVPDPRNTAENVTPVKPEEEMHQTMDAALVFQPVE